MPALVARPHSRAGVVVMAMTGYCWIVSAETAFDPAAGTDKSLAFVEGASHGLMPCQPSQRSGGSGNTARATFDRVAARLGERF